MAIRIFLSMLTLAFAALSIFLPVKLTVWDEFNQPWSSVGGLELEFPFTVPFYLLVLTLSILFIFFKRFSGTLVVFILSCLLLPYTFLIWVVIEFSFFEVVKPGLGAIFIPMSAMLLFTMSLVRMIAVGRARKSLRSKPELIDDLDV